jgi:hypothetical protein
MRKNTPKKKKKKKIHREIFLLALLLLLSFYEWNVILDGLVFFSIIINYCLRNIAKESIYTSNTTVTLVFLLVGKHNDSILNPGRPAKLVRNIGPIY